jgi:hypothetical protein
MTSFVTETPAYLGQFPALAMAVRQGHVKEADITAARRLTMADAFSGLDKLGGPGLPTAEALAVGRVVARIADGQMPSDVAAWDKGWDRAGKTITSSTGELRWDYGKKVVTLNDGTEFEFWCTPLVAAERGTAQKPGPAHRRDY